MKIKKQTVKFAATGDFELGLGNVKRETEYTIYFPTEKAKGLVVFIPGFGEDAGEYRKKFCQKLADKHHYACMSVDYHCFYSRPPKEQGMVFEKEDVLEIEKLHLKHGIPMQGKTVEEGLELLNQELISRNLTAEVSATMKPLKNEYQNGGIMQALDIINSVGDALIRYHDIPTHNVILIGSSYGGYIANLASKYAPNTFRAVIDNSSWALPNFIYVVGRDYGIPEFKEKLHSNIKVNYFTRTSWTLKKDLPNTFDGKRFHVRAFTNEQIGEFANYNPQTYFYYVHAENDLVAPTQPKIDMAKAMIEKKFQVHMEVMGEQDIDGVYVKSIDHGMGLSLLTLFSKAIEKIEAQDNRYTTNDFAKKSVISYSSAECIYEFDFSSIPVQGRVLCNK